jgi:hypothetical protein
MEDVNRKRTGGSAVLNRFDLAAIFKHFEKPVVDYVALREMISDRFENPIMVRICTAFANNMEQIEAGRGAQLDDVQGTVAKGILSLMINLGRIGVAKEFLTACVHKWDKERFIEWYTMLMLADEDIRDLDIRDKPWLDYQVIDRKEKTTVIMFCGHAHRFGIELNAVVVWLRSLPVNLIFLRDFNRRLYLSGVKSIGDMDQTVKRLQEDLARLGTERIVTMGNSGGVYGALHFGHRLGASQVLCFGGPTSLKAGVEEASDRPVYLLMEQMAQAGELTVPDLRQCFIENGISVRYFYGQDYQVDAAQAEILKDIPNVSIEPVSDWSRHVVLGEMARRKQLKDVFANAVSG